MEHVMNGFQDWPMFWLGIVQTILVVASLLLLRRQIRQATNDAKSEHERRCREATIQFFSEGSHRFYTEHIKLEARLGSEAFLHPLTPTLIDQIVADGESQLATHHMLSFLEGLSTGVNQGVFDHNLADKLLGGAIIEMWRSFAPYIRWFRDVHRSQRFFDQFEILARTLEDTLAVNDTQPVHSLATPNNAMQPTAK
jgi:hypothetical protein